MTKPKEKTKRRKRCESCQQLKHDVEHVQDPFALDVHGEEVWMDLCAECYNNRAADI